MSPTQSDIYIYIYIYIYSYNEPACQVAVMLIHNNMLLQYNRDLITGVVLSI